jgi:hypothetical protein
VCGVRVADRRRVERLAGGVPVRPGRGGEVAHGDRGGRRADDGDDAAGDLEVADGGLESFARVFDQPQPHDLSRSGERASAGERAPARERPGAGKAGDAGVGPSDPDVLERELQGISDELGERRVRPLPDRRRRQPDGRLALRVERDVRRVVALDPDHPARLEDARAHPGRLDVAGDAEPEQPPLGARRLALGLESVVADRQGQLERARVRRRP